MNWYKLYNFPAWHYGLIAKLNFTRTGTDTLIYKHDLIEQRIRDAYHNRHFNKQEYIRLGNYQAIISDLYHLRRIREELKRRDIHLSMWRLI